jgi:hypothetical protein
MMPKRGEGMRKAFVNVPLLKLTVCFDVKEASPEDSAFERLRLAHKNPAHFFAGYNQEDALLGGVFFEK